MDKEEILKKSRAEQSDEGDTHAWRGGVIFGFLWMSILYVSIWFATFLIDETKLDYLDSMGIMYHLGWGVTFLIYGIKARKRLAVVVGFLALILTVLQTVNYFMGLLG